MNLCAKSRERKSAAGYLCAEGNGKRTLSPQLCERYAAEGVEECFEIQNDIRRVQHIHVCVKFNNVDAMNSSMIADAIPGREKRVGESSMLQSLGLNQSKLIWIKL